MQFLADISAILGFQTSSGANILLASIPPQVLAGSVQGNSVSMGNYNVLTAAIIDVGTVSAGLTSGNVQVEEWNGTTASGSTWTAISGAWFLNGASTGTANPQAVTTAGAYCFLGLRTQGYCRVNAITMAGTTVSVPMCARLLGMPRSESSSGVFSRSPNAN